MHLSWRDTLLGKWRHWGIFREAPPFSWKFKVSYPSKESVLLQGPPFPSCEIEIVYLHLVLRLLRSFVSITGMGDCKLFPVYDQDIFCNFEFWILKELTDLVVIISTIRLINNANTAYIVASWELRSLWQGNGDLNHKSLCPSRSRLEKRVSFLSPFIWAILERAPVSLIWKIESKARTYGRVCSHLYT